MKGKTNLALCLLLLSFCGLMGKKGVPKEQVNADLAERTISVKDASDTEQQWSFKEDSYRCFAPSETPSKITESEDTIPINVSAVRLVSGEETPVLFGEIVLHYKKDDDKWVLESIEPKDVRTKALTGDAFSKYLDLQMPLCNYFKYRSEK
jgi:hypothetical protein